MREWLVAAVVGLSAVLLGGVASPVLADTSAASDTPGTEEVVPADLAGRIADDLADPLGNRLGETLGQTFASLFPPVWRDPESAVATVSLGATDSLTHTLQAPMAWAWRWMLTVPDSIQPATGGEMDSAFSAVPGGIVLSDLLVTS
ncbi:MAG: hypothetical protein OXP73_08265, partial [Chloroflexota bacterium]|nr:hypothetical protein [Chloroflexota bacterium]